VKKQFPESKEVDERDDKQGRQKKGKVNKRKAKNPFKEVK